jgi:hypothetical protein
MTAFADPMVHDELMSVVSTLCARFPNRSSSEIAEVVAKVHAELTKNATVTSHLIPLTLNRSRRLLSRPSVMNIPARRAPESLGPGSLDPLQFGPASAFWIDKEDSPNEVSNR